jgi:xanthine dehydrogenase/oxidase
MNTLHACLLLSSQCGCVFEAIDTEPALAIPGVVNCFTYEAINALGGINKMGPIFHDEYLFLPLGEMIVTVGQVLGVAVAETLELAERAAMTVEVKYGPVHDKIIVSIEDAIAASSFFEQSRHKLERGDKSAIAGLPDRPPPVRDPEPGQMVFVAGTFRLGGQEHFYLETNSTLVVPSESDTNLTVYCSTQAPTKTQNFCASTTGTPASKVVVRMKRMGGGFGGKETRSVFISAAAAVAAKMTSRPVRLTLSRHVDMSITGSRHAFVAKYKASALVSKAGHASLQSCDIQLYSNAGWVSLHRASSSR